MEYHALTVKELIEKLQTIDQSLTVVLEGCDCAGKCGDVVISERNEAFLCRLDYLEE